NDHAFTAPLSVPSERFKQIEADFDVPGDIMNHDPLRYLSHDHVQSDLWRDVAGGPISRSLALCTQAFPVIARRPERRRVLLRDHDCLDAGNRLQGCTNDVFLISSILQDKIFEADEIRGVLNDRAPTAGILDRLHWLLDGVKPEDERFLFYNGH